MTASLEAVTRPAGDDVIVPVRVRKANLEALQRGVKLGIDAVTLRPITMRLVLDPREGGATVYAIEIIASSLASASVPDPAGLEQIDEGQPED